MLRHSIKFGIISFIIFATISCHLVVNTISPLNKKKTTKWVDNGNVIISNIKSEWKNDSLLPKFYNKLENKEKGKIKIINFGYEHTPVLTTIKSNGKKIVTVKDYRRDKYAPKLLFQNKKLNVLGLIKLSRKTQTLEDYLKTKNDSIK